MRFPEEAYLGFLESYNSLMNQLADLSNNFAQIETEDEKNAKLTILRASLIALLEGQGPIKDFFKSADLLTTDYTEEEMDKIDRLTFLARNLAANMKDITRLIQEN